MNMNTINNNKFTDIFKNHLEFINDYFGKKDAETQTDSTELCDADSQTGNIIETLEEEDYNCNFIDYEFSSEFDYYNTKYDINKDIEKYFS
jgi:hypothetical protein